MIEFNYNDAIKQANELEQIAQELQTLLNKTLRGQRSELEAAWSGESAQLFLNKTEELYKDINNTAKRANSIAGAVGTAAKALKAAEDAAKQVIKTVGL